MVSRYQNSWGVVVGFFENNILLILMKKKNKSVKHKVAENASSNISKIPKHPFHFFERRDELSRENTHEK